MLVWFEPHERMDEAIAREKYNNSRVIARNASERRGDPGALLQPYNPELLRRDSPSEGGRLSALWLAMTTAETFKSSCASRYASGAARSRHRTDS
jgi:hypothetical protein